MELRDKLLATNLFIDNEYFEKYVSLIESNRNTTAQRCKTQKHHIVPNIAFKLYNWPDANAKDNLVVLLYKDHILAHYYLALAAKQNVFKYKMVAAINFILGKASQVKLDVEPLKTFTLELDKYQELYEIWRQEQSKLSHTNLLGHETSEETKKKISLKNKGRIYVNKDDTVKSISPEDLELFLNNGWNLGNTHNQVHRDTGKGRKIIHRDLIEKYCKLEDLESYLQNGWELGHSDEYKKKVAIGTQKYYDTLTKEEKIKKCGTRTGTTHEVSTETRLKISKANKGKKWSEKQKQLNSINKKGTIHMTNGIDDIMIKPELEQEFLNKGYYRGRSKNRKENKKYAK